MENKMLLDSGEKQDRLVLLTFHPYGPAEIFPLEGRQVLGRMGDDNEADIQVLSYMVSRRHGEFRTEGGQCYYRDLGSSNGTWINEEFCNDRRLLEAGDVFSFRPRREPEKKAFCMAVSACPENYTYHWQKTDDAPTTLASMDLLRVGDTWFYYTGDLLWCGKPEEKPKQQEVKPRQRGEMESASGDDLFIDIREKNVWMRRKKKTLLKDISLIVEKGDFVLILGGSGAGKTTFMNAVMGYEKADGSVRYGNLDIYEEYEKIKHEIGYVPQQDLLRMSDTVYHTLYSAAEMKMGNNSIAEEHRKRTEWAMSVLALERERDTLVGRLSGGQRKRLSIAVELVGNPGLFFLDEPDSGLDGIMAKSLMEKLKTIADMGKIVMVITHGPDRVAEFFTKVLVLAKSEQDNSGHLAYYGGIPEAKDYFGTDSLEGIVEKINRKDEGGEGLADYYISKRKA